MDLYNHSLLVIMKNEDIDFECLPHTVKEDIKHLKVTFQKLKDHRDAFDAYHNILSDLGETTWETLFCQDCGDNNPFPLPSQQCFYHYTMMNLLMDVKQERKEISNEMTVRYSLERSFTKRNFPHLLCVVKKLEDRNYCDICEELHI